MITLLSDSDGYIVIKSYEEEYIKGRKRCISILEGEVKK